MLRCRFKLSSFDLMPESFLPETQVEFTMPGFKILIFKNNNLKYMIGWKEQIVLGY